MAEISMTGGVISLVTVQAGQVRPVKTPRLKTDELMGYWTPRIYAEILRVLGKRTKNGGAV